MNGFNRKLMIGLLILTLLSPLGIILPKIFNAGKPWGEWSTKTVAKDKGYTPKGMQKDANLYKAPISDYNLGKEENSMWKRSENYILSAIIGLGAIAALTFGATKLLHKK